MSPQYAESVFEDLRTRIEYMLDAGDSFGQIEDLIEVSDLTEERRAELWRYAWKSWSERVRGLHGETRSGHGSRWRRRAGGASS